MHSPRNLRSFLPGSRHKAQVSLRLHMGSHDLPFQAFLSHSRIPEKHRSHKRAPPSLRHVSALPVSPVSLSSSQIPGISLHDHRQGRDSPVHTVREVQRSYLPRGLIPSFHELYLLSLFLKLPELLRYFPRRFWLYP